MRGIAITREQMVALPAPTWEQAHRFILHLMEVHSWYKARLLGGGDFLLFLAPDAGENYPLEHPSLPFGNHAAGYQRAFGYLDYLWDWSGDGFRRDNGVVPVLPMELWEHAHFVFFPYVSSHFGWGQHQQAARSLRDGHGDHPRRAALLEWWKTHERLESLVREHPSLADALATTVKRETECPTSNSMTPAEAEYRLLRARLAALATAFQKEEEAKAWRALLGLLDYLGMARNILPSV